MGKFNPNPTEASGGIVNLPKGSYTFEVGVIKAFDRSKTNPDGSEKPSHGVQVELTVISEGPAKNKKIYPSLFQHNEGSRNMTKAFQLAVLGYTVKNEDDWNKQFGGKDWSYEVDDQKKHLSVGSGWSELKGKVICADLDITMGKVGDAEFQSYKWRPYN